MEDKIITWVCKTCGRSLKAEEKPNYCYYDRTTAIENISDEDAVKMGLFSLSNGDPCIFDSKLFTIEFIKDVRYAPISGKPLMREHGLFSDIKSGYSLDDYQNKIMSGV